MLVCQRVNWRGSKLGRCPNCLIASIGGRSKSGWENVYSQHEFLVCEWQWNKARSCSYHKRFMWILSGLWLLGRKTMKNHLTWSSITNRGGRNHRRYMILVLPDSQHKFLSKICPQRASDGFRVPTPSCSPARWGSLYLDCECRISVGIARPQHMPDRMSPICSMYRIYTYKILELGHL